MKLFAIGDLHLPGGDEKPMNVFGAHWDDHFARICADWRARVTEEDVVLIPGDISWAMQMKAAEPDLLAIAALPGRKVILKGNHDYWWTSITQVRAMIGETMRAVQNDALDMGEFVVCGSRGWLFATKDTVLTAEDERVSARELLRLEMSLQAAQKIAQGRPIVVMMHFPPLYDVERDTPFTQLLERYPVHTVVYGHLHGAGVRVGYNGLHNGLQYHLTSCDALEFRLKEIPLAEN